MLEQVFPATYVADLGGVSWAGRAMEGVWWREVVVGLAMRHSSGCVGCSMPFTVLRIVCSKKEADKRTRYRHKCAIVVDYW